jgi:hypothetical protein
MRRTGTEHNRRRRAAKRNALLAAGAIFTLCGVSWQPVWGQAPPPATVPPIPAAAPPLSVSINGQPLTFTGQGPIQRGGTILVPLRGIFEKLGAEVKFDSATQTITAIKNEKTVQLQLGQATAMVNDQPRTLSVPAQSVNGATLVPLRFVSEAMGAMVDWEPSRLMVEITTDAIVAAKLPTPPADNSPVLGTLTGIFPEISAITVRVATGDNTRVSLLPNVDVIAREPNGVGVPGTLNTLRTDDQVTVRRSAQGFARVIEIQRGFRRGILKETQKLPNGNFLVRLTNGTLVEVAEKAPITMARNFISLSDVRPGERLVIRMDTEGKLGIALAVATPGDPNPIVPDPNAAADPDAPPPLPPDNPPAPAPKPEPLPKPELREVTHNAGEKILRMGDSVTVTVTGTPMAKATVSIPGLPNGEKLDLAEKPDLPGVYVGTFPIPPGITLNDATITATLTVGDKETASSTEGKATVPLKVDTAGPSFSALAPTEDGTVPDLRPRIYGAYSDLSQIDAKAIQLQVNGQDVTASADVTDAFFSYSPKEDLPLGKNTVTLIAKDKSGNEAKREWAFTVVMPPPAISKITLRPAGATLRSGDELTVRVDGLPGGTARYRIGDKPMEYSLKEEGAGIYLGIYTVQRGDNIPRATVTVLFQPKDSARTVQKVSEDAVTLSAIRPTPPVIDQPLEGRSVGSNVSLSGRAQPGIKVRVSIRWEGKGTNGTVRGDLTVAEVIADDKGKWFTEPLPLDLDQQVGSVIYTAEIVAVAPDGETSTQSSVRFKQ